MLHKTIKVMFSNLWTCVHQKERLCQASMLKDSTKGTEVYLASEAKKLYAFIDQISYYISWSWYCGRGHDSKVGDSFLHQVLGGSFYISGRNGCTSAVLSTLVFELLSWHFSTHKWTGGSSLIIIFSDSILQNLSFLSTF